MHSLLCRQVQSYATSITRFICTVLHWLQRQLIAYRSIRSASLQPLAPTTTDSCVFIFFILGKVIRILQNRFLLLPPSSIVRRMKEYHRYQGVELTLRRLMQWRINAAEIFLGSALMLRFAWCMAACNPSIRDCMAHAPVFNCT